MHSSGSKREKDGRIIVRYCKLVFEDYNNNIFNSSTIKHFLPSLHSSTPSRLPSPSQQQNLIVELLQFMSVFPYEEFSSSSDDFPEPIDSEQQDLICVKNLIPKPNPLMNKIQFLPYQPKQYYPGTIAKLPDGMSKQEYHFDRNNMSLIDESVFTHEKLRRDVEKCLQRRAVEAEARELATLREFYASKAVIYEKYASQGSYFATYLLNLAHLPKQEGKALGQASGPVRRNITPLITERFKTERNTLNLRSHIQFNSNFQSGNLFRAYQRQHNEYDLILQNDINTKGNNQWFFFSVRNVAKGASIKFNIVNLSKKHSLFEYGMKPSVFSVVKHEKRNVGWVRDGTKVAYRESSELRKESSNEPYYCLSFEYRFVYEGDIVYFSYALPYTFQNLTSFLTQRLGNQSESSKIKLKSLGYTLGGNEVNLFQISSPELNTHKKSIWILARQHSGQTTSSFMLEGMVDFLLSNSEEAEYLLSHFVFKIVPMVNIDGVVHGNTRAELIGCDSNRKWADPHKYYQPVVYTLRKLIEKDRNEMVLDLHSHSRKLGTFFYANHAPHLTNLIKIFPMMVCQHDPRFDYRSNRFRGGSNLTARKVLFDMLKIPYVYTVQSSFYGYQKEGDFNITPYQPKDYRQMGESILKTFAGLSHKQRTHRICDQRLLLCRESELDEEDNLWKRMNEVEEIESVGSDEDPAEDEFNKKQLELIMPRAPKKSHKHKKRRFSVKAPQPKAKKQPKQQQNQPKPRRLQNDSCYKKYFTGRCSLNLKRTDLKFPKKFCPDTKNFAIQVDIPERSILNRSTNVNLPQPPEKVFEKRGLCVIGQKFQEQLTISSNSIGIQVQMAKIFLKSRHQIALSSQSLSKRAGKKTARVGTIMLHNENNFLNRGDILHSALRMLSRK